MLIACLWMSLTNTRAGSFTTDFSNPVPEGFYLNGNGATRPDGNFFEPVIENGHLVLTWNEASEQGTIVLEDLDEGMQIDSFTARFKLQIGPGSGNPADGLAFSFGPEVDLSANFGEEGVGNGIIVSFDIYDNGGGEAPAIDVKYNGVVLATQTFAKAELVTSTFEDVEIRLQRNGMLSVSFKSNLVHEVFIGDFVPTAGLFAIGARTGGESANHWLDDLTITTTQETPTAPVFTTHPVSQTVQEAETITLTAAFDGSAPFTLQWLSNSVAIPGATSPSLTLERVPFSANGAKFQLQISNGMGEATSEEATITVTPLSKPLTLLYATGNKTFDGVRVWFSDPVDPATAETASNYQLSGGVTVTSATLSAPAGSPGDNIVDLVTSAQTPGQTYTLTVSGVKDQTAAGNTVAEGSSVQFSSFTLIEGGLLFEHWDGLTGASEADLETALLDPRVVANKPTTIGFTTRFDTDTVFTDDSHENYLVRLTGWITPTETAEYYFFLRADDAARFYISEDESVPDPALVFPTISEPDCCNPFYEPEVGDPATTAFPIPLEAGKRYGVLALLKEGGGGDYLQVAWRQSTDATPAAELPYIPGQYLSAYFDPNVDLNFVTQPVDQSGTIPTPVTAPLSEDFASDHGSFTVVNTQPAPPGPWVYNSTTGEWVAEGSNADCGGPYNSRLTSPTYTVAQAGTVTLTFKHRYSFEGDFWDGGQLWVSVNGGDFTDVTADAFLTNGYGDSPIVGNGVAKDKFAFSNESPGYSANEFITTSVVLGTFQADDQIAFQFVGAWDDCSTGVNPNWVLTELQTDVPLIQGASSTPVTFSAEATASRQGVPVSVAYQWQRDDGDGFKDIPDATASSYQFYPSAADFSASFRVLATVTGKTATSEVVQLTTGTTGEPPTIAIARSGDTVSVTYTGTLESSSSVDGPYSPVANAQSPYTVQNPGSAIFFRSVK